MRHVNSIGVYAEVHGGFLIQGVVDGLCPIGVFPADASVPGGTVNQGGDGSCGIFIADRFYKSGYGIIRRLAAGIVLVLNALQRFDVAPAGLNLTVVLLPVDITVNGVSADKIVFAFHGILTFSRLRVFISVE